MDFGAVVSKRVYVMNGDMREYVDIYPNHVMVYLVGWRRPRRFVTDLKELYQRLHNGCGLCHLDNEMAVSIDLDPLYDLVGDHRERMIMLEFEQINDDACRAKLSFRDLVEAIYFWIG